MKATTTQREVRLHAETEEEVSILAKLRADIHAGRLNTGGGPDDLALLMVDDERRRDLCTFCEEYADFRQEGSHLGKRYDIHVNLCRDHAGRKRADTYLVRLQIDPDAR